MDSSVAAEAQIQHAPLMLHIKMVFVVKQINLPFVLIQRDHACAATMVKQYLVIPIIIVLVNLTNKYGGDLKRSPFFHALYV